MAAPCQTELDAYSNAVQLLYQSQANLAAAMANVQAATALVNTTWAAYEQCLSQSRTKPAKARRR